MKSLSDLLDSLLTATELGTLKWETDFGQDNFITRIADHKVRASSWYDGNSETDGITISLLDASSDTVLDRVVADKFSPRYAELTELFEAARRSAFNVSDIVSFLELELAVKKK